MATQVGEVYIKIGAVFEGFDDALKKAESATIQLGKSFEGVGSKIDSVAKNMVGFGKQMSMFITAPLLAIGGAALKSAADLETNTVAFEVMLGSAEKAQKMLADLATFAAKTPFALPDLQEASKLMLNFGIAAEDILPNLQMLGDVAGGNAQKLQSLALVFSQVSSAGKLQGQDLLQLINAGFNPLKEISDRTGQSMGELRKKMEQGAISADMVSESFKKATGPGGMFFGMMEKQSQTLAGRFSTLKDTAAAFGREIMEVVVPVISEFIAGITALLERFTGLDTDTKTLIITIGGLAAALGPALILIGKMIQVGKSLSLVLAASRAGFMGQALAAGSSSFAMGAHAVATAASTMATNAATAATRLFNLVLKANPLFGMVALIASVAAGIYALAKAFTISNVEAAAYSRTLETLEAVKKGAIQTDEELDKKNQEFIETALDAGKSFESVRESINKNGNDSIKQLEELDRKIIETTNSIQFLSTTTEKLELKAMTEQRANLASQVASHGKSMKDIDEREKQSQKSRKESGKIAWQQRKQDAERAQSDYLKSIEEFGLTAEQLENLRYDREVKANEDMLNKKLITQEQYQAKSIMLSLDHTDKLAEMENQRLQESAVSFFDASNAISGGLSEVINMGYQNELDALENKKTVKLESIAEEYEAEKARIMDTVTNTTERDRQLEALDLKRSRDEKKINEKTEKEKRRLQRESAEINKNIAIYETTISTAQAVMRAWSDAGPFAGPILATLIASLGAAKIGLIASQPLPVAARGIYAESPYIGGEAGPELAFPLSSPNGAEALSLFSKQLLNEMGKGSISQGGGGSASGKIGDVFLDGQLVGEFISAGTLDGNIKIYNRAIVR